MGAREVAAAAVVAVVAAGCMLVTGSTDGYSTAQTGPAACTSAGSCGDGGMVCCLSVTGSTTTSVVGSCQASCTQSLPQLCTANAECGDAGPCSKLSCTVDGSPLMVTLQACGTVQGCSAAP